jgi:hypothetical protein
MPLTTGIGVTGRVAPTTLLTASAERVHWSAANDGLTSAARDTWQVSGGMEWDAIQLAGRDIPLRVGARQRDLPFAWEGSGWAVERAVTAGLGVRLGAGLAALDLAGERGTRGGDGAGIDESFWRISFTATVLGR